MLLIGAPGTGKTLLARAVAGEAGVPFFSISASEFIEAIVGVGAARVRDLFQKARAAQPAIVFIDELDAIGRSRSTGARLGGNEEQEQTLNQVLTEMDGFDPHTGVIVLAATNRADVLDAALLRPGRFDRRVTVPFPDRRGRLEILRIHTRHIPLGPDVNLDLIASLTAGMVGADLRNLANEAALAAARRDATTVAQEDFSDALEKVELGSERKLSLTALDREKIAYHESGHALLGLLQPGADPVRRVSIIPRGQALGVTVQSPVDDRFSYGEDYLRGRITGALGGRAAEELVYGIVTTGAESDLRQVTAVARQMVVKWGMSAKVGVLSLADEDGPGQPLSLSRPYSEETAALIDEEVRRICQECLRQAVALLTSNRDKLDALVHALLEHDTLGEAEILAVTGIEAPATLQPQPADARAVPQSRVPEVEDDPSGDAAVEDILYGLIHGLERARLADDAGASARVELVHLIEILAGADDRADDGDAVEHRLKDRDAHRIVGRQRDEDQRSLAPQRCECLLECTRGYRQCDRGVSAPELLYRLQPDPPGRR